MKNWRRGGQCLTFSARVKHISSLSATPTGRHKVTR